MRIVFFTTAFNFGGAQRSSIELAKSLSKSYNVLFLDTYGSCIPYLNCLKKNDIVYNIISESSSAYIINKHRLKIRNIVRYFIFFFKWCRIKSRANVLLNDYKPDIIVVNDFRSLSFLFRYANTNVKIIFNAREWCLPSQISFVNKLLLRKLVNHFICASEATKYALYCGKIAELRKMSVIHNILDESIITNIAESLEDRTDCFKIVHPGAFIPEKGHLISLKAARILKKRKFGFHIYLCGLIYPGRGSESEQYLSFLKNYVIENQLDEHVTFIVNQSNIISIINGSDIMFFPSSTEGLPRSVLESMFLGIPVVANSVGGITDIIIDRFTGLIANYNDPVDYADLAELLKNDASIYNRISLNSKEMIKVTFNADVQSLKLKSLFNNIQ